MQNLKKFHVFNIFLGTNNYCRGRIDRILERNVLLFNKY